MRIGLKDLRLRASLSPGVRIVEAVGKKGKRKGRWLKATDPENHTTECRSDICEAFGQAGDKVSA